MSYFIFEVYIKCLVYYNHDTIIYIFIKCYKYTINIFSNFKIYVNDNTKHTHTHI